jgi:uncharacterized protein with GYD domain
MPLYLTRFSYTPATWAKLINNPEDRRAAAKEYIEGVGGNLQGFWYAFGDHDGYNLWEAPDNVSMAATALAIGAGGALSSVQTTVLLTSRRRSRPCRRLALSGIGRRVRNRHPSGRTTMVGTAPSCRMRRNVGMRR